jgi:hypothetical protein
MEIPENQVFDNSAEENLIQDRISKYFGNINKDVNSTSKISNKTEEEIENDKVTYYFPFYFVYFFLELKAQRKQEKKLKKMQKKKEKELKLAGENSGIGGGVENEEEENSKRVNSSVFGSGFPPDTTIEELKEFFGKCEVFLTDEKGIYYFVLIIIKIGKPRIKMYYKKHSVESNDTNDNNKNNANSSTSPVEFPPFAGEVLVSYLHPASAEQCLSLLSETDFRPSLRRDHIPLIIHIEMVFLPVFCFCIILCMYLSLVSAFWFLLIS